MPVATVCRLRSLSLSARRMAACLLALTAGFTPVARAQPATQVAAHVADEIVEVWRPRIAVAGDGAFALAYEARVRESGGSARWTVLVQRYAPDGRPTGPLNRFDGESCSGLDLWLGDLNEHAEIRFQPGGVLVVLMQHSGEYQFAGRDGVQSAEITLAAIGTDGQVIDLHGSGACVQQKLIFVGGGRQDRPRLSITPQGALIITADGFFDGSPFRSVALRVLDADGSELIEQVIPHDDPRSQQSYHRQPDVASNGSLLLSVWNACPMIDSQGNAADCDVGAQFATATPAGLVPVGGNQRVNAGEAPGTLQLYPSAAMNAAGQSVIVWADARDGRHGEIYGQRFGPDGRPVGPNFRVSTGTGVIDSRPEVAVLDDGRFAVVWTDSAAAGFTAWGRTFAADATPLGPPFRLADGDEPTGLPHVAVASDAHFAYTWLASRNGAYTLHARPSVPVTTHAEEAPAPPAAPALYAPQPNPFATRTTLSFFLPEAGRVRLTVFDALGREVAVVVDDVRAAGHHTVPFDGSGLTNGAYFVQIEAGAVRATQQALLIR